MKTRQLTFALTAISMALSVVACVGGETSAPDPDERTDALYIGSLPDPCVVHELYDDGWCDRICYQIDSDCPAEEPAASADEGHALDVRIDEDDDETDAWSPLPITPELEDWEEEVCGRFTDEWAPVHELAESLCIAREGEALQACITACVDASEAGAG